MPINVVKYSRQCFSGCTIITISYRYSLNAKAYTTDDA